MAVTENADGPAVAAAAAAAGDDQKSARVIDAVTAKKMPPPEPARNALIRRLVVFAFWAVFLILGFPMWWKTTEVYRADLPLDAMNDWAGGKVCTPHFPIRIRLEAPDLPDADAHRLVDSVQRSLNEANDLPAHDLQLFHSKVSNDELVPLVVRLATKKVSSPEAAVLAHSNIFEVSYAKKMVPSSPHERSDLGEFIATELLKLFAEERAMLAYSISPDYPLSNLKHVSPELVESLSRRTTRAVQYAPTYHLTFSLVTPESQPSSWDINAVLEETLSPLLESLSSISNFTVDSQIQSYATFSSDTQPAYDDDKKIWTISRDNLGGFINAAEWPLSPSIGTGPTINFILFSPAAAQSPLHISSSNTDSWIIPQWGGVTISNPEKSWTGTINSPSHLTTKHLRPAFLTFSHQLLSLLGIPSTPSNSLSLRLATLTRQRALSLIFSASSTLGSLARLTKGLPSISIPNPVAQSVSTTLAHLDSACENLRTGAFQAALDDARIAEWHAEKAFFERSMVGQVYFPDEHKVAVYLPLLGPVAVPLLLSAAKEIKELKQRMKKS